MFGELILNCEKMKSCGHLYSAIYNSIEIENGTQYGFFVAIKIDIVFDPKGQKTQLIFFCFSVNFIFHSR